MAPVLIACSFALGCKPDPVESPEPTTAPILIERELPGPRFVDAYVANDHGCAIERGGQLWCWGADPGLNRRPPIEHWHQASRVRGFEAVAAVAGADRMTCVLYTEGQIDCWKGSGSYDLVRVATVADAVDIAVENWRVCVRRSGGEVECWWFGEDHPEHVASGAIDFACKRKRECSLDDEGGIWCWDFTAKQLIEHHTSQGRALERGPAGELLMARVPGAVEIAMGDSKGDVFVRKTNGEILIEPVVGLNSALPVTFESTGVTDATALAFGDGHGCVITQAAEVRCFGGNGWAQLGDGGSGTRTQPVTVPGIAGAHEVIASNSLSCALHGDDISCWGTYAPRLEWGMAHERHVATRDAVAVVADRDLTCATLRSGENVCWGLTNSKTKFEFDPRGIFASSRPSALPFALGQLSARVGDCFLDDAGLFVCGSMRDAERREQATVSERFEESYRRTEVRSIAAPYAMCWIDAGGLECVDYDGEPLATPRYAKPRTVVDALEGYCVLHERDQIGCFNWREDGSLARLHVPIADVVYLGEYDHRLAAIGVRGAVRTFSLDWREDVLEISSIETLPLENIVELTSTLMGGCGRTKAGELACFNRWTNELTHEFTDVIDIAGTWEHTCVLQADGTLTCMGDNRYGELGGLPSTVIATPLAIEFVEP